MGQGAPKPHIALEPTSQTGLHNTDGTIAMARTPNPDSASTEFFLCIGDNRFLDAGGSDRPRLRRLRESDPRRRRRAQDPELTCERRDANAADSNHQDDARSLNEALGREAVWDADEHCGEAKDRQEDDDRDQGEVHGADGR